MTNHHIELVTPLVCDVCDGMIWTPDELASSTGCCRACGVAYDFELTDLDEAIGH